MVTHNWGIKIRDIGIIYDSFSNGLKHYEGEGRTYARLRTELTEPWKL